MKLMPFEPELLPFLRDTVAKELRDFSKAGLEYYGFTILCNAIEATGSFFDGKAYVDHGESRNRFQKGFEHLFPDEPYQGQWVLFFEQLRGPLVHQLRPGHDFTLSCERKTSKSDHFQRDKKGQIVLIYEKFCEDFEQGLVDLAQKIESNALKGVIHEERLTGRYIETFGSGSVSVGGLSAQP